METKKRRILHPLRQSLHLKLALILVLLVFAVMVAVGEYLVLRVPAYYEDSFRKEMYNVFTADTISLFGESTKNGAAALRDVVSAYSGRMGIGTGRDRDFFILDGATGEYLEGGQNTGTGEVPFTPNILKALNGEVGSGNRITDSVFDLAVPVGADNHRYIVYIRDGKSDARALEWMLISIVLQAILFGLVVAILLSFVLSKTLTKPIEELTRGAKRVSEGEFELDLPVRSEDEIGGLTDTFNEMAGTLERSITALNEERDRYASLLLYMTDGVAAFNAAGALGHINPAAREMLGVGEEDEPTFGDVFSGTEVTAEQILALPGGEYAEVTLTREENILQVILSPTGSAEAERGIIAVVHNVTRERKLEDARRKFVADVSHELRTPLTSIKGYAETIAEDDGMPPALRKRFLGVVQNEADRMLRIVRDLLTLSRMDNRSMSWRFEWVDMENLLEDINTAMQIKAAEKHHRLTMVLRGNLPLVWCDKERIEQVVVNLLTNAVNYTPEEGVISLVADRSGDTVQISVQDNGIGIAKEDVPHLFDRFYRVDKARSRESGGSGLGLSITSEIVQKHKGTIQVESELGHGTTMTVLLPVDSGVGREENREEKDQ